VPREIQIPSVPPQIIAWVHKHAGKQFWRVIGLIDYDDLVAEGYYAIAYCLNKYGKDLDAPHLMRLVQITYHCAITDIANKRTKYAETHVEDLVPEGKEDLIWNKLLGSDSLSDIYRLVAEAPDNVRRALIFLMVGDTGKLRKSYSLGNGIRETTSKRLAGILGIDSATIMDEVREYLRG
jgi:hypothetical protein